MPIPVSLTLVLIDDTRASREGAVALIRAQTGFRVLTASAAIEDALRTVRDVRPDVVLLNVDRLGGTSVTLAGALHGQVPESRIIVLGLEEASEDLWRFVRAGVSGFILASATLEEFRATILSVARGIQVLPPGLTASLFSQLSGPRAPTVPGDVLGVPQLTPRERQVAESITSGLSNKEIAARLGIALHTVKSHVHKVLTKLAAPTRLQVAALARRDRSSRSRGV